MGEGSGLSDAAGRCHDAVVTRRHLTIRAAATVAAAVVALTGCAGTDESDAGADGGSECEQAWQEAADEPDADQAHDLMHHSFHRCATYDEWLETGEDFPVRLLEGFEPEEFVEEGCLERDIARSKVSLSRR